VSPPRGYAECPAKLPTPPKRLRRPD